MNTPSLASHLTLAAALETAITQLDAARGGNSRLDAEILLAHLLSKPRSHLRAWPEQILTPAQQEHYFALIARRASGTPVAYLTGEREFWSLTLSVNPSTLIPRADTERLVELALERIPADHAWRIADIGTGSGAIAIALASERPRSEIVATDICPRALATARHNAEKLGLRNIQFHLGDGIAALPGERFDMICSNPPYIAEHDPHLLKGDLTAEPRTALVAGANGLEIIAALARAAPPRLRAGGWLVLEHGYNQGPAVAQLLIGLHYRKVQTCRDYADQARVTLGQRD